LRHFAFISREMQGGAGASRRPEVRKVAQSGEGDANPVLSVSDLSSRWGGEGRVALSSANELREG